MPRATKTNVRSLSYAVGWVSLLTGLLLFIAPDFSAQLFGMPDQAGMMRYLGARDLFIGGAILLGRKLALWMMARAVADSADVAIVIAVLVTGTPHLERALFGLLFAGSFCCLDIYLSQRLRSEERALAQPLAMSSAARGVEVGRGGVRSVPE